MWTCLYFHTLPLQVQGHALPLAVSDSDKVFLCNASAASSGIKPGMKLGAAFALDFRLSVFPRDEKKELAALQSIALTAMQFTSMVSLTPPFAVLLEIGGSLSLFGGLHRLLEKIKALCEGRHDFGMASAPTASGAWLLARAGRELHITEIGQLKKQLSSLPVELLECTPEVLQGLKHIGMRTIEDVLALPRDGFARRFGQELLDTLDRALGNLPDARPPFAPPANYANKLELPAPIYDAEALLFGARRLIGELAGFLSAKGAGVLQLNLDLYHEDESVSRVPFTFSLATRDPAHLNSIFRERLFDLTLPSRIEAIALEAGEIVPLRWRNFPLFAGHEQEKENRAQLIERLQARLGADAVMTLQLFPDHRPERAWRFGEESTAGGRPVLSVVEGREACPERSRRMGNEKKDLFHPTSPDKSIRGQAFILHPSALRPLWLIDPPRPLKQETIIEQQLDIPSPLGGEGQGEGRLPPSSPPLSPRLNTCRGRPQARGAKSLLTLLSGPERIESGWWDGGDAARDYFVARDSEGAKFWVFRQEQWFLHGIFA